MLADAAIGNLFVLRLNGRLIHDCMNSTFVDSVFVAETETEVESTSAISIEVQSLSKNLKKSFCGLKRALGKIYGI